MKTRILSKLPIFLMTAVITAGSSYGAEAEQSIQTTVQPTVAIEKQQSTEATQVYDKMKGFHSGLKSVFSLKTNGVENDYDFIIHSTIKVGNALESAYGNNGQLLFALDTDTAEHPTLDDVEDARKGGSKNRNVIAYPVSIAGNGMDIKPLQSYRDYGYCYMVDVKSVQEGTVIHEVIGEPVLGSYNTNQDQAGIYKAVVYFTAVHK